jgi:hypothetical protein
VIDYLVRQFCIKNSGENNRDNEERYRKDDKRPSKDDFVVCGAGVDAATCLSAFLVKINSFEAGVSKHVDA